MNHLPHDPAILVSSINMLLRDNEFDTLDELCYCFGEEPQNVKKRLYQSGYVYSKEQRQFRPKGYDSAQDIH